jgi:hypothetical protein
MYIVVEHEITNPTNFWDVVQKSEIPSHFKLHQSFPSGEGTKAVCLWEASKLEELKGFVEDGVGNFSINTYFSVEADKAFGLPATNK